MENPRNFICKNPNIGIADMEVDETNTNTLDSPRFFYDEYQTERYHERFQHRSLITLKYAHLLSFDHLPLSRSMKHQGLDKFMEYSGNVYPELVRVFYSNLQKAENSNHLISWVKGVVITISSASLDEVLEIPNSGKLISSETKESEEEFNKMEGYIKLCRFPKVEILRRMDNVEG